MKGELTLIDYSLLKNKVYLTLLAYYDGDEMPSFIELGKKIGISRQTASTKVKELLNENIIALNDNDIVIVANDLNIDKNELRTYLAMTETFSPQGLKEHLFGVATTQKKQAKELDVSRASLYLSQHTVVYGIHSEGKIKYIGTSSHFEDRIQQHIKKRPFLTPANFIILVDNSGVQSHDIERELIHLLQPEWNIMSKI